MRMPEGLRLLIGDRRRRGPVLAFQDAKLA
jgi:hypothetical protein